MKAGVLYLVDGTGPLNESVFPITRWEEGQELKSTLHIEGQLPDLGDLNPTVGTATYEIVEERTQHEVRTDGTVDPTTRKEISSISTDLLYVEGMFVCTARRDPKRTIDIIETALPSGSIEPARIDVETFVESVPDGEPYRSGFYDRNKPVEKGISHGDHDSDDEFRGVINEARLNEIGLGNYDYDRRSLKVYLSESGYVAVRSNVKTQEFARFIRDCIIPYANSV